MGGWVLGKDKGEAGTEGVTQILQFYLLVSPLSPPVKKMSIHDNSCVGRGKEPF